MKIAVVGAHGTGKTTLCREIAQSLDCHYIPDVVAEAFRLGFDINEETPPESQFWILSKQLELERNTPMPWVMEKSLWDNLVYGSFSIKDKKVLSVIEKLVRDNAKYDTVFYLPVEFSLVDDGLRSLNVDFQKFVDTRLLEYMHKHNIQYHTLSGSISERLERALAIIEATRKAASPA